VGGGAASAHVGFGVFGSRVWPCCWPQRSGFPLAVPPGGGGVPSPPRPIFRTPVSEASWVGCWFRASAQWQRSEDLGQQLCGGGDPPPPQAGPRPGGGGGGGHPAPRRPPPLDQAVGSELTQPPSPTVTVASRPRRSSVPGSILKTETRRPASMPSRWKR